MKPLYFVTGNQHKLAEIQAILPHVQQLDIDLPEIQSGDPHEIVTAKLQEALKHHEGPCMVEDTGLYFDVMNGLPGPFIKFFMQRMGALGLANLALNLQNTKATAKTYIAYAESPDSMHIFEGEVKGDIVLPRKESAFGRDPIFQPEGMEKTFAELTSEQKNAISMRRKAAEALKAFLLSHP